MKDKRFTAQQHKIWSILFNRQSMLLRDHAASMFWDGFKEIQFPSDHIPSLDELNEKITRLTGWKTVRTAVRYSTADQWYPIFVQKKFPLTTYVRSMEELDFTPEPDVFHDTFGHLAFFTIPRYTEFAEIFAPAFLRAKTIEEKENVKRLAWFSYEFGVQIDDGKPKAFGAGLISSFAECKKVISGEMNLVPFTVENVLSTHKTVWDLHSTLFTFSDVNSLQTEIESYLHTI